MNVLFHIIQVLIAPDHPLKRFKQFDKGDLGIRAPDFGFWQGVLVKPLPMQIDEVFEHVRHHSLVLGPPDRKQIRTFRFRVLRQQFGNAVHAESKNVAPALVETHGSQRIPDYPGDFGTIF